MENTRLSFEEVLNATVRLLRTTWKTEVCLFLQLDDKGDLRARAADGLPSSKVAALTMKPTDGPFANCFAQNRVVEAESGAPMGALAKLLKPHSKKGEKYVLVPVSGETRVLGVLFMGPFPHKEKILP